MTRYLKFTAVTLAALAAMQSYAQTKPANERVLAAEPGFAAPKLAEIANERPALSLEPAKPSPKNQEARPLIPKNPNEIKVFKPSSKNVVVTEATHQDEDLQITEETKTVEIGTSIDPSMNGIPRNTSSLGSVVSVKPGETQVIPIAVGVLNRFVTPFAAAAVDTVSDLQVKTAGSVVLIATSEAKAASLIVREKTNPENAIMLTLMPQKGIQARDVRLSGSFPKTNYTQGNQRASEDDLERGSAHPLAVRLKNVMRDLAQSKIPSGHSLADGDGSAANCLLPGLSSRQAQILNGSNYQIAVYALRNVTDARLEVDERGCSDRNHLASAVWPLQSLEAGEQTELYLVEAVKRSESETPQRPSAIQR